MTIISTGLRNHLMATGSLLDALEGGDIKIYSGTIPANADAALGSAVLLCTVTGAPSGIEFESAPVAGVLLKKVSQAWTGTNAASGTASFFRVVQSSDTGASSSSEVRLQGTVGILGADLELTNVELVASATLNINSGAFTLPPGV